MDSKIEQVKKIITDLCDGCEVDGVSTGLIEIASKEIVSALYSEPQVVCPACKGSGQAHYQRGLNDTPAIVEIRDCPDCNGTGCVPVPSTPASEGNQSGYYGNANPEEYLLHGGKPLPPDELLTDEEIEEEISFHIKMVLEGVASCLSHFERVDYQKVAEVAAIDILAKCHQSEAAEIAELRAEVIECNNEIETLTDFKVRSMDEYEKADAEIAELKAKIERLEGK